MHLSKNYSQMPTTRNLIKSIKSVRQPFPLQRLFRSCPLMSAFIVLCCHLHVLVMLKTIKLVYSFAAVRFVLLYAEVQMCAYCYC